MATTKDHIRRMARSLGIDRLGFARATELDERAGLDRWLADGHQGSMGWMERLRELRLDPRRVTAGARTIVSVAVNYYHPARHSAAPGIGKISRYAWGGNYHKIVKKKLVELARALDVGGRLFVDTGPVMEKPWAATAGVGWVGKNGNVLTRDLGSWVFLGELLVDAEFEPDPPATDHCGSCSRCIDACPTDAIPAPTVIDSRRCISYLTIEHRGSIDPSLRSGMADWIFGCDICQDVCPWNKFQKPAADQRFAPRDGNRAPDLVALAALRADEFDRRFSGSNVRRARYEGFIRNVMVALGNGQPEWAARPAVLGLEHTSPLVREHAAWATGRLGETIALQRRLRVEDDATVRAAIEAALAAGAGE